MEQSVDALPINFASPVLSEWHAKGKKRLKVSDDGKQFGTAVSDASLHGESKQAKLKNSSLVTDYSDPYAVATVLEGLDCGKFGSATRDIESLISQNRKMLQPYFAKYPKLTRVFLEGGKDHSKDSSKSGNKQLSDPNCRDIVVLEDVAPANKLSAAAQSVVIIDSDDEEDGGGSRPFFPFQEVVLSRPPGELDMNDLVIRKPTPRKARRAVGPSVDTEGKKEKGVVNTEGKKEKGIVNTEGKKEKGIVNTEGKKEKGVVNTEGKKEKGVVDAEGKKEKGVVDTEVKKENGVVDTEIKKDKGVVDTENKKGKGVYVGIKEEDKSYQSDYEDDSLNDMWKEMTMALEGSKDIDGDPSSEEHGKENGADCDHSFVLKDDLGYVCRVCGVIDRGIETIFEFQFNKGKRSTRTYVSDYRNAKDKEFVEKVGVILSENDLKATDIAAHPRHMKQMKPHQVEGFNFLVKNLVSDNPGGCILAHAPGSGKTFMIISFMQSFLAKYPQARPLVVLPKGILGTWKKEFQTWQVEDIPLLDLYTGKVDNRSQQLDVLNQWVKQRSILFLGYKQFSSIVCDSATSNISASCQKILLKAPTILILDEGHTPRNEDTDVLQSLAKVQTPRKVVLSGTLYQNHVKEVFNILNLVRPKFLRLETSRSVVKRIMSRVQISGIRKQFKGGVDTAFYESVEHSLHKDEDFKRKVTVIHDLREMTSSVLHYYKGDFLDELPGLVDFTVLLKLSPRQKNEIDKLKKGGRKFKISSDGSAVSVHPKLITLPDIADNKIDDLLENLDVKDGVKAKFYLNMLKLCESADEKMLVFSQYLLPLKFLERLTVKFKGWSVGREIFFISGDTSSENREWAMEQFNNSPDAKVFFGSIKACGEGISLVGGSRVIILDVHLNPSVSRQALGRAFRPGQKKKVFTYRLVSADSPEEEDHTTCFKKESIAKMWFEWNEYCGFQAFEMETVDVNDSGDIFFDSPMLAEDVKALYKR